MPVKGINKTLRALQKFGIEAEKSVEAITAGNAQDMALRAKSKAPVGVDGYLRNQINVGKVDDLNYEVLANAPYSGYVEFGTGTKVQVPPEMAEVAKSIQGGSAGSFKAGLEAIKEWCRKKGILEAAAYPIFMKILKYGIEAQPFLYPALVEQREVYLKDLKDELKRLSNE